VSGGGNSSGSTGSRECQRMRQAAVRSGCEARSIPTVNIHQWGTCPVLMEGLAFDTAEAVSSGRSFGAGVRTGLNGDGRIRLRPPLAAC
jgi:hypothetical protein